MLCTALQFDMHLVSLVFVFLCFMYASMLSLVCSCECLTFLGANAFLIGIWVIICAVAATLLNFVRLFCKAHEENKKQAELEKKKVQKEAEMEKAKGINLKTKKGVE